MSLLGCSVFLRFAVTAAANTAAANNAVTDADDEAEKAARELGFLGVELLTAVMRGYTKIARELIDAGADINVQDVSGRRPLHLAVINEQRECVKLLIDAGAEVSIIDREGKSLVYFAVINRDVETLEMLIDAGVEC